MAHYFFLLIITYIKSGLSVDSNAIIVWPFSVVPSSVEVLERTPVTAYCGSNLTSYWSKVVHNNRHIHIDKRHLQLKDKITFVNMLREDSGVYFCHGYGFQFSEGYRILLPFIRSIIIRIQEEVKYGQVLPSRIEINETDSITLSCGSFTPVL